MNARKFCSIRVYTFGNSYVLASDSVKDEKLQIRMTKSTVCINNISNEEWSSLTDSRTNSVTSPSFANVFTGYGFLGLLSTSLDQTQPMQVFQQQQQPTQSQYSDDSASMQHFLLFVKDATSVGTVRSFEFMRITDIFVLPLNDDSNSYNLSQQSNGQYQASDFINEIRKLLCSGVFYFSVSNDPNLSFDLTLSSQARNLSHSTNKKFLWNYNLHIPLRRLNVDTNSWLLKIICGYAEIRKIIIHAKAYRVGLISRLSCDRVGARFHCRGINDHGNCANFVETEQIVYATETDEEISFLQLRGSVPVFFEQTGIQVGSHRIKIARSIQASYPAFERHFQSLIQEYGSNFLVLNLLGTKGDEESLSDFYKSLCEFSIFKSKSQLVYTSFDYHYELKMNKLALNRLWKGLNENFYENNYTDGVFFYSKSPQLSPNAASQTNNDNDSGFGSEATSSVNVIRPQTKFIRTNCMDCLDRTNCVQAFIGREILRYQLRGLIDTEIDFRKFVDTFNQMWVSNGDNISRIYAGTGAIQGRSVTKDITTSLSRAFQNNFLDDNKHDSIDSFLFSMSRNYGHLTDRVSVLMSKAFLRLPYSVLREIVSRKNEYTEKEKCRVMIGTWNINGGLSDFDMNKVNLNDWLIDGPLKARKTGLGYLDPSVESDMSSLGEIDIFAIGFEEIVDLNAQSIVKASEENASNWRIKINEFLKRHGNYVELINENLQLVGACLFVFVLKKHLGAIRDVCVAKTKTGFGGTAGNKGGVLLRFIYYNTSMCFVCSHFAAHQKEIRQRNDDFRQIYEQSVFSGQKSNSRSKIETKNHDYIFWCGDLNYRIDIQNDRCRMLINEKSWDALLEADQLSIQRKEQNVFREFHEAPISFPPTYKYNVNEDTYDRSEKCRVPAWTDRILWRRRIYSKDKVKNVGKCLYYGRADIRYSDHRPVSSLMEVEVNKVIPKRLIEVLNKVLLSFHGSFQVVLVISTHTNQMDENIKKEILNLFMSIPTFAAMREFKSNLYITYSDGKFAYEAYAQFNNYNLDNYDLTLQIRVENEKNYQKIIEEELMDCLTSLDYYKNNLRKMSVNLIDHKVADLLGSSDNQKNSDDSDDGSYVSYINVPSQLHSNISITNNMHNYNYNSSDLDSISLTDPRHEYHNPMTRAHSNTNLNIQNHVSNHTRFVHSEANLLDLSNDDSTIFGHNSFTPSMPPQRPPPPPPPSSNQSPFETLSSLQPKMDQPLIEIITENNFGFDDDFGSLAATDLSVKQPPAPARPPPIPPLPNSISTKVNSQNEFSSQNNAPKTFFSLFDDSFEVQSTQLQPIVQTPVQPTLPLYTTRPQSLSSMQQQKPAIQSQVARPPPLPPLPAKQITNKLSQNALSYISELESVLNINSSLKNVPVSTTPTSSAFPPPLPPPPKLPIRMPPTTTQQSQKTPNGNSSSLDLLLMENLNFGTSSGKSNDTKPATSNKQTNANVDPWGEPFKSNSTTAPLAPPRMNHFS